MTDALSKERTRVFVCHCKLGAECRRECETQEPTSVPYEAQEIVMSVIHGEPTTSSINANYLAYKALRALIDAGWTVSQIEALNG
jgi:hypothetical protein